jgi:hypothetical protein
MEKLKLNRLLNSSSRTFDFISAGVEAVEKSLTEKREGMSKKMKAGNALY